MKVLVIGANGFLGRNLVKRCLEKKWEVICVYHNNKDNIPKSCVSFHIDDLDKRKDFYDAIFLLAAYIPYENFDSADKRLIETNINIPLQITKKFKESKIVFSSSVSVYGRHRSAISETSSFNNPNLYGLSKICAEFLLKFHPDYQIVRFSSIYGKGMTSKTFIPRVLEDAKKNKKITLWGNGSRLQDYLYIGDAVNYLLAATRIKKSGIYLGVSGKSYSNTQVAKIIQKFIPDCSIEYKGGDVSPSFVYNNSMTRKLLNFTPKFSLEKGMGCLLKNE